MKKATLLVVEDEAIVANDIRGRLERMGFGVCSIARTGLGALSAAEERKPDLVLMDVHLEGQVDGIEAASQIRRLYGIPVVYLTAYSDTQTLDRAKRTEPHGFLLKPFNDRELRVAIETALDRHRSEVLLRRREQWLSTTLSSIGDAVIATDLHGRAIFMNAQAERLTGYDAEDAIGQPVADVFRVRSEKGDQLQENLAERAMREGRALRLADDMVLETRTGQRIAVADSVSPIMSEEGKPVGAVIVFHEVTERRRLMRTLEESEHRFRTVADFTADLEYWLGPDGRILYISPSCEAVTGYPPGAFLEDPELLTRIVREEDRRRFGSHMNTRLAADESVEADFRITRADGEQRWIGHLCRPMYDETGVYLGLRVSNRDITRRKRAEEALAESEARFRAVLEALPNVAVQGCAPDGRVVYWNQACERLYGWSAAEAVGRSILELNIPDDLSTLVGNALRQGAETGELPEPAEYLLRHKDGSSVPVFSGHAVVRLPGRDAEVFCADVDLRALRQVEHLLAHRESQLQAIFDATPDAVFLKDVAFRYEAVNAAACRMLGRSPEEILGKTDRDLFDPETADGRIGHTSEVLSSGRTKVLEDWIEVDGNRRCFEIVKTPVHDKTGDITGVLVLARDVTERKQAEQQRARLEQRVQRAKRMESLGLLAGGIAHDFNNLLTAILGNADLTLMELPPNSTTRSGVEEIKRAGLRAAELAGQMLAFSGGGVFTLRSVDLRDIVRAAMRETEAVAPSSVAFRQELTDEPVMVVGDGSHLHRAVWQIARNAVESIAETGGRVTVRMGWMDLDPDTLEANTFGSNLDVGPHVYIEVEDTGCGMDEELIPRIFEPFFTGKFAGRGLGLAEVLGVMRAHHGAVQVHSRPKVGTRMRLLIPGRPDSSREDAPAGSTAEEAGSHWTVVVADDEPGVVQVAEMALKLDGFNVLTCGDGVEAVELVKRNPGEIDAILMDVTMPHMNGVQAASEILEVDPSVRIILSSGYSSCDLQYGKLPSNVIAYLKKPYHLDELTRRMRKALRHGTHQNGERRADPGRSVAG